MRRAALREAGPFTIAGLARRTGRNDKNVHADVQALIEWMVIGRRNDGRVSLPWSEIVLDMTLPQRERRHRPALPAPARKE
jgi:predicted transcriptional regulator